MEGGRHSFSHKRLSEGVLKEVIISFLSLQSNSRNVPPTLEKCYLQCFGEARYEHTHQVTSREWQKVGRKAERGTEMWCVTA